MDVSEKNTFPMLDKAISKPLTDNRTADALKNNTEGLLAAGREPDMSDLRYIKLNRLERLVKVIYKTMLDKFLNDVKNNSYSFGDWAEGLMSIEEVKLGDPVELPLDTIKAIEEEVTKPTAIVRGQRRNIHLIEDAVSNKLEDTHATNR